MLPAMKKYKIDRKNFLPLGKLEQRFHLSPAEGAAGGMPIGWKSDLSKLTAVEYGRFSL